MEGVDFLMDDFMKDLREMLERRFPGAVSVGVFVDAYKITISPEYRGELLETSMKKIDGSWCSERE